MVARSPLLLVVPVGAEAPRQEAEAVHLLQLRAERIRDARLEPADPAGARTAQHDAGVARLREERVHAVHPPDREHVRRVAAAHEDQILVEHRRPQVLGGPGEELEPRHLRHGTEPVVAAQRLLGILGRRGPM